jgi:hypothetical protein
MPWATMESMAACEKGEVEEPTGMLWRGKSTMNRQLRGGRGGDHKSSVRTEAEEHRAREE